MKIYFKYLKSFNVLIVLFENKQVTSTKKEVNIELLYNNKLLIGANIFNPEINQDIKYNLEDKNLLEYIKQKLDKYIKINNIEKQFVVGKIIECEPIPDSHLNKCKVNIGTESIQIVCGASNARKDLYVAVATLNSFMPNGLQILPGKLKGVESFGMLCSFKELEISDSKYDKPGIMELNVDDSKIGSSIWEVL